MKKILISGVLSLLIVGCGPSRSSNKASTMYYTQPNEEKIVQPVLEPRIIIKACSDISNYVSKKAYSKLLIIEDKETKTEYLLFIIESDYTSSCSSSICPITKPEIKFAEKRD